MSWSRWTFGKRESRKNTATTLRSFRRTKSARAFNNTPAAGTRTREFKKWKRTASAAKCCIRRLMLDLFALDDPGMQEACFRVYNDWLIDYCSVDTNRLIGIPAIPVYNIDNGIKELERCRNAGLKGAIIWQAPHPDLPFHSSHYDKFWAAAQDLEAPVSLHILTGHSYNKDKNRNGVERYRGSVNLKLMDIANALFELIFYGVLERYPKLKIVSVENEAGWLPWITQQWDYYYRRFRKANPPPFSKDPSEYFRNQIYSCFFNDSVCGSSSEAFFEQDLGESVANHGRGDARTGDGIAKLLGDHDPVEKVAARAAVFL